MKSCLCRRSVRNSRDKTLSKGFENTKEKSRCADATKKRQFGGESNSKDLPQGWTKEKVAMAYHMAGQRGGKGKFLKMWKDKYAFKLSQQES